MEIKFDYYIKQDSMTRLMHTTITESDIINILKQRFIEGELGCPINYNRGKCSVEFVIDKVIV